MLLVVWGLSSWLHGQPGQETPVVTAVVKEKSFVDEVEGLGTLRANESVTLSSTVTERVTAIYFDDGQLVEKGDLLLEMDIAEEQAELAEEKSVLERVERELERAEALIKSKALAQNEFDSRKTNVDSARARIAAIQSRMEQRQLRAPFSGLVGLRNLSVGALVQPGTIITTIDDLSIMKLDFRVPSLYLDSLKKGASIRARSRAFPEKSFEGEIVSLDSRIDPITRTVLVRAMVPNPGLRLRSGLLMQVLLENNARQSLQVPESALLLEGDKTFVWRLVSSTDGKTSSVEKAVIEVGVRKGGFVEVLAGLRAGDEVVTHGTSRLRPGAAVVVGAVDDGNLDIKKLLPTLGKK